MVRGLERCVGHSSLVLMRKRHYLVTLALVSFRRNSRSRTQTSIFTIDNQHFLVQMAPRASWPPGQESSARSSQPGVLSQDSSARSAQQELLRQKLSQESSVRIPQPGVLIQEYSARSLQPICLGSSLESFVLRVCLFSLVVQ